MKERCFRVIEIVLSRLEIGAIIPSTILGKACITSTCASMLCISGVWVSVSKSSWGLFNYHTPFSYVSEYPSNCNGMIKIPRLRIAKAVVDLDENRTSSGGHPMLCSEQKPVAMMRVISRKYWKHGRLVLALWSGNGATAKACFLRPKHRKIAGFDVDSTCMTKMRPERVFITSAET